MQHYYGEDFGKHCVEQWLSPIVYITLFTVLENVLLLVIHGSYIGEYYQHLITGWFINLSNCVNSV